MFVQAIYIAANIDEYNRDDVRASKREEGRFSILFAEQHKRKHFEFVFQSKQNSFDTFDLQDDFIALELVDRKVRFVWNVGGGTGILTHPEIIHSSDIQDDKSWYRIEAER